LTAGRRFARGKVVASDGQPPSQGGAGTVSRRRVRPAISISVALPPEPAVLQPAPAAAALRYQFALALRELARRREPVRIDLVDAARIDGTIEAVGSDYLLLAEHDPGEARRRTAVRARRFIGFSAMVAVTLPRQDR
jgi:hypothetical protein